MSLLISLPLHGNAEAEWTCFVLLGEMLGVEYRTEVANRNGIEIVLPNGSRINIDDHFFRKSKTRAAWFAEANIPKLVESLTNDFTAEDDLPIIYGANSLEIERNHIHCGIDIFASCFFMLSRWEEIANKTRDNHDRFPASASLAYKAGFLYRPVVDEYAEMLWAMLQHLCPKLERKHKRGEVIVSCDVDTPFDCSVNSAMSLGRTIIGDLIKRRSIALAGNRIQRYIFNRLGNYRYDPYYTFPWYMDTCERHGRKATFFFIPDRPMGAIDGCYNLYESRILELIKSITDRGHYVGVHGSYNTYQDTVQVKRERHRMMVACKQAGVVADVRGNRQHYLRWDAAQTPDHLDAVGFEYDTSGSYADMPGFRYGTSQTFTMWSLKRDVPLKIKQRPLVVMECSVIDDSYLGLKYSKEAMELMLMLKNRALKYGGDFTLLWHNSHFLNQEDRQVFVELIR